MLDLRGPVGSIGGDDDEASPEAGDVGDDEIQAALRRNDDPVAGPEPRAQEPAGASLGSDREPAIRERFARVQDEADPVGIGRPAGGPRANQGAAPPRARIE